MGPDARRVLAGVLCATLVFTQGCHSRRVTPVDALGAPAMMRLTHKGGFIVRRFASADSTISLECRVTRMDGRLDRASGTTLFFTEAMFRGARPDGTRCSGPATVYVVPPEHPDLRLEVVRFDPLGSLMTIIILAPFVLYGLYVLLVAVEDH